MRSTEIPTFSARALQALLALVLLTSSSSCFVEQHGDMATVRVSIDLGLQHFAIFENQAGIRDDNGLLHLDQIPAFLQVWVTGPGIDEPTISTWPDERVDLDSPTISLDLVVPAGDQRKFTFLAYVFDGETFRAWSDDGTVERDLPGGLTSELAVALELVPTGSLIIELTGPSAPRAISVVVVDGDPASIVDDQQSDGPAVAYPPIRVEDGPLVLDAAPIGRPLSFRIITDDGELVSPSPVITLEEAGQVVDVEVQVP